MNLLKRILHRSIDNDVKSWTLKNLPKVIDQYADNITSYPKNIRELVPSKIRKIRHLDGLKAWKDILYRLAEDFREADPVQSKEKNEYHYVTNIKKVDLGSGYYQEVNDISEEQSKENEKYLSREKELKNYRQQRLTHGLEMFVKLFDNLGG